MANMTETNQKTFQPPMKGIIAAAVTPLNNDGSVNLNAIRPIVDRLLNTGVSGFYVCGSTGEGVSLSTDERKSVTAAYVQAVDRRVPVIVQAGHNSLAEACELARHAQDVGADVLSATCPSYFKIATVEALVDFMSSVASSGSKLPFYYYHIPTLTGSQVNIGKFLNLASKRIPSMVGVKYSTTLLHEFQSCQSIENGKFDIVWGCDEMLLGATVTGAAAAIGSTYNVATPLYKRIAKAALSGELTLARDLQLKSVRMVEAMAVDAFHPALKATMEMLGMPAGPCRTPLGNLTEKQKVELRARLDAIGFFEWCGHSST